MTLDEALGLAEDFNWDCENDVVNAKSIIIMVYEELEPICEFDSLSEEAEAFFSEAEANKTSFTVKVYPKGHA